MQYVLATREFGDSLYVADPSTGLTVSANESDALVFDERDNPVHKLMWWRNKTGLDLQSQPRAA